MITHGPLVWPVNAACDYAELGLTTDQAAACEQAAGEWLWQATAARFGLRSTTWRPRVTPAAPDTLQVADPLSGLGWTSVADTGVLAYAYAAGGGVGVSAASGLLRMPPPVDTVTTVTVDGVDLASSAYQLEGNVLRRLDGGTWPASQDVTAPVTDVGTWQVTYVRGRKVPEQGRTAAGVLACELAKMLTGAKDCKIPVNAVTVARNGTVINVDKGGLTGLTNVARVDQWIRLVNPKGLQRPPTVFSPDARARSW